MIRLLQISDIHFTDVEGNDDAYGLMRSRFLEDIKACREEAGKIDRILICGDIAFSGMESQYSRAREFIAEICKQAQCTTDDLLIVPGNHDKKWDVYKRTRMMMRESLLKGKNTKQLLQSKVYEPMAAGILLVPFKQYYKLALEYSCISDVELKSLAFPESNQEMEKMPKFVSGEAMYWSKKIADLNGYPLIIHGGNTSLLSDSDDGESRDLKEGKHLQVLPLQTYNVCGKEGEIHVLMLHHPMTEIVGGKDVGKDIDGRFQLQFFGHIHKQSSSDDGTIKIYSGAFQPEEEEDNTEYFPVYNLIEVDVVEEADKPYLKVDVFCRKWDGARFDEYLAETKKGDDALKVQLPQNDAWKRTKERISRGKDMIVEHEVKKTSVEPHVVRSAFLGCGREGRIITEMYDKRFDDISPNRIKYLSFLRQVEIDARFEELYERLKRYE
ncbi:MAG: metallophosphoesterase [Prevotella sp.]|nr:metallophosphoesterase [Prevotella sp.]